MLFPTQSARSPIRLSRLERTGYVVGTAAGLGVFAWTRGFVPRAALPALLAIGLIAALMVLIAWIRAVRSAPADTA